MPPSKKSTSTHYDAGISNRNDRDYSSGRSNPGKLNAFDIFVKLPILLIVVGFIGFFAITGGTLDMEMAKKFFNKLPELPSFLQQYQQENKDRQEQYVTESHALSLRWIPSSVRSSRRPDISHVTRE